MFDWGVARKYPILPHAPRVTRMLGTSMKGGEDEETGKVYETGHAADCGMRTTRAEKGTEWRAEEDELRVRSATREIAGRKGRNTEGEVPGH